MEKYDLEINSYYKQMADIYGDSGDVEDWKVPLADLIDNVVKRTEKEHMTEEDRKND